MLCTLVLNGVVSALRALPLRHRREFRVVTVSFDPHGDPRAGRREEGRRTSREYRRPGAEAGWHFLTGDAASIRPLAGRRSASATPGTTTAKQYAHASGVVVAHARRAASRTTSTGSSIRRAICASRSSRRRTSKIGIVRRPAPAVLLPLRPDHRPVQPRRARTPYALGGVLTVLALGTFLFVMLRRDRTAASPQSRGRRQEP